MRECLISKRAIKYFIALYLIIISLLAYTTPLSYSEADILFRDNSFESTITQFIFSYTHNQFFLRLPFILISILSIYLYLELLKKYFKEWSSYYNLSIFVYLITPGVLLSSILVNYATLPIFTTLLFIYANQKNSKLLEVLSLVLLFFTHSAYFVIYIAVIIYSYRVKDLWTLSISTILLIMSLIYPTYSIGGIPKGHLLQLIGIYAAIFSPLLFLAILFSLYKSYRYLKNDLLVIISITSFILSILLSIRQKIKITDFSVFFIFSTPLLILTLKKSIEVRLREFHKKYYLICKIVISVLLLETFIIIMHHPLYIIAPQVDWLIDKNIYSIPSIVKSIKSTNKECKKVIPKKAKNLYKYYGIEECK